MSADPECGRECVSGVYGDDVWWRGYCDEDEGGDEEGDEGGEWWEIGMCAMSLQGLDGCGKGSDG